MAKQAKQDMFGIGAEEDSNAPQDEADEAYVVLQIIPAEGWRAVFRDSDLGGTPTRILGVAGFALVEVIPDSQAAVGQPPIRAMRPMVATESGEIEDAASFEDFLCVVPPGGDVDTTVDYAIRHPASEE
jgi:hypothetical protein